MINSVEISVLMSAYNASKYLRAAMDSILTQTFANFEFIIVNDGSTDATENIIRSYTDNRIVYVRNDTNLGLIESLNKGLDLAKGKYIARMDADDIAMPERLQDQLAVFREHKEIVAVGSDYYLLSGETLNMEVNINDSDYQKTILLFATCFAHPTVMIKNIFKETGLRYNKEFNHTEDYKLWTDLSFHGDFYNVGKPLLKYRSHPTQVSVQNRSTQFDLSDSIRRNYLQKLGFSFSEEEFKIHSLIGNNEFIRSKEQLLAIETWLNSLVDQNESLKKLKADSFKRAIHKFWFDSCGNTNLGLYAFKSFTRSGLSKIYPTSLAMKSRLFGKCVLRFVKK